MIKIKDMDRFSHKKIAKICEEIGPQQIGSYTTPEGHTVRVFAPAVADGILKSACKPASRVQED